MPHPYPFFLRCVLLAVLWLTAFGTRAQGGCATAQQLQVTDITATTATFTCVIPNLTASNSCAITVHYTYVGGNPVSVPYANPLYLTNLPPATTISLRVVRDCRSTGSTSCDLHPTAGINFTTVAALATQPATKAGNLTLVPNPTVAGRTTLTLATPLAYALPVYVHDALGRVVRQLVVPARASSAEMNLTGLGAGVYVVRCGNTVQRLVVE